MKIGSFKVAITPFIEGAQKIGKQITEDVSKGGKWGSIGSDIGSKIGGGIKTGLKIGMAGLATAAAGIGSLGAAAIKAQSEIQQSLGGAEAVFESSAGAIKDWAASAAGSMGISTNAALETANKMGSLFQGSGFSATESAEMTMEMSKRAADVASIMGLDLSSAMEAVTGAAKGNFTMMDNLGVAMNATSLSAYAVSKGIDKSWNSMTNAEKTGLAYQMFMEETAKYAGNFEKENKTLAGSFDILKSSWQNVLYSMGDSNMLDSAIGQLSTAVANVIESVLEILPTIVTNMGTMIEKLVPILLTTINDLIPEVVKMIGTSLPPLIQALADALPSLITTILDALTNLLPVILDSLLIIFKSVIEMLPSLINDVITFLIDAFPLILSAAIELFMAIVTAIPQIIDALVSRLPEIITTVVTALITATPQILLAAVTALLAIVTAIPQVIVSLVAELPKIGESIMTAIEGMGPDVFGSALDLFNNVWLSFTQWSGKLVEIGAELVAGIWEGIKGSGGWLMRKIDEFASGVVNGIKGFFGIHSPSVIMRKEVGAMVGAGVGLGILDSGKDTIKKARSFSNMVSDAILVGGSIDLGYSDEFGGGASGSSGGVTVNNYVDQPKDMLDLFMITKRAAVQGTMGAIA